MRWLLFAGVAGLVLVADQATKILAVAHLTPGVARLHRDPAATGPLTAAEQDELLGGLDFLTLARDHYGSVRSPCGGHYGPCRPEKVVAGFWNLSYAENRGAAWSTFARLPEAVRVPFLVSVAAILLGVIVLYARRLSEEERLLRWALSLVAGGALGNLVDRARMGYVVDFIQWYWGGFYWPTFNIADAAISSGVALIALGYVHELWAKRRADPRALADPGA